MISDELAVADAHPLGARPFARRQYVQKFTELAEMSWNPLNSKGSCLLWTPLPISRAAR